MDPYAKPNEWKVGAQRPKISHVPSKIDKRTQKQRQAEKQRVAAVGVAAQNSIGRNNLTKRRRDV
jgi:hypothetical protein